MKSILKYNHAEKEGMIDLCTRHPGSDASPIAALQHSAICLNQLEEIKSFSLVSFASVHGNPDLVVCYEQNKCRTSFCLWMDVGSTSTFLMHLLIITFPLFFFFFFSAGKESAVARYGMYVRAWFIV